MPNRNDCEPQAVNGCMRAKSPASLSRRRLLLGAGGAALPAVANAQSPSSPSGREIVQKVESLSWARTPLARDASDRFHGAQTRGTPGGIQGGQHGYEENEQARHDRPVRSRKRVEAKFSGNCGWYWRNRGKGNVVVSLRTNGAYGAINRVL